MQGPRRLAHARTAAARSARARGGVATSSYPCFARRCRGRGGPQQPAAAPRGSVEGRPDRPSREGGPASDCQDSQQPRGRRCWEWEEALGAGDAAPSSAGGCCDGHFRTRRAAGVRKRHCSTPAIGGEVALLSPRPHQPSQVRQEARAVVDRLHPQPHHQQVDAQPRRELRVSEGAWARSVLACNFARWLSGRVCC
eukprot:COSAG01_NODE_319_length_18909_cov_32.636151_20_plen_196_part_00